MHISEGIITGVPAALYTAAALGLMGGGARAMRRFAEAHPEKKPLLGMAGAFIFFVSLIPLPSFAGTCSHPCGSPLAGILLGPWIGIAITGLALFLQAAFFAHGGFSTWGANVITLGVGGAFGGWLAFRIARRAGCPLWLAGALGGLLGDVLTYLVAGLSLSSALTNAPTPKFTFTGYLAAIYAAYLPIQGPIALGEMVITGLALHYIYKQRPGILAALNVIPGEKAVLPVILAMILSIGLAWPAAAQSSSPKLPAAAQITLLRQKALWLATGMNGILGFAGFRKDSTCVAKATPAEQVAPRPWSPVAPPLAGKLTAGCFTSAGAVPVAIPPTAAPAESSGMPGMDEAVNERMAENAGRAPRDPYINTEAMGDVWNFILLGAGAVCGFIIGRRWHLLFGARQAADKGVP